MLKSPFAVLEGGALAGSCGGCDARLWRSGCNAPYARVLRQKAARCQRVAVGAMSPRAVPQSKPGPCPAKSKLGQAADLADDVALGAGVASAGAVAAGLITAETGAGPAIAGIAARGLQGLSTASSIASIGLRLADRDYQGAAIRGHRRIWS